MEIRGRLSAIRAPSYTWRLQWAPGIEPCEAEFQDVGPVHTETAPVDGPLGTIDLNAVRSALEMSRSPCPFTT